MDLDDDFKRKSLYLIKKISSSKKAEGINFNTEEFVKLVTILQEIKPKSKTREYKQNVLLFLTSLLNNLDIDEIEYMSLKREKLDSTIYYLQSNHGIHEKNYFVHIMTIIGLVIDIVLALTGIAEYYYYVPVFMLIMLFLGIRKHRRLKKEGKILDL